MATATERTTVTVYGTDWCGLTRGFRNWLETIGVPFDYRDIERDAAAEAAIVEMNGGKRKFPMVVVGEIVMKNPPVQELNQALNRYGLLEQGDESEA